MFLKRRGGQSVPQMNDLQLLAHLLSMSGTQPTRARENAHILLDRYQSLEHILSLPQPLLLEQPDLVENEAVFLLLLAALMRRYAASVPTRPVHPDDLTDVEQLLLPHFRGQTTERVYAFCLDRELSLISSVLAAQGGADAVYCSAVQVLRLALNHRSSAVIVAHNHPDGTPEFSKSDLLSTSILFHTLSPVGIALLDHYLLAGDQIVSLRRLVMERKLSAIPYPLPPEWFPPDEKTSGS